MRRFVIFLLASVLVSCDDGADGIPPPLPVLDVALSIFPEEGSSYGNFEVFITAEEPIFFAQDPREIVVQLGEVKLIFLEKVDDFTIRGISQGHPAPDDESVSPFRVDLSVTLPTGIATAPGAFQYLPPLSPVFNKIYGIGASFTAGVQSNSINFDGQRNGPVALVAKQIGAFFSQPYAVGEGLPPRPELADIDPTTGLIPLDEAAAATEILNLVNQGGGTFLEARADPTLFPRNIAVPGGGARHILQGTTPFVSGTDSSALGLFFLEIFIQKPETDVFGAFSNPEEAGLIAPIEILENDPPTAILASVDFFANDVLGQDDVPTDLIREDLEALFDRIVDLPTRPPFFTLSLVDVNVVPRASFRQDERYEILRSNAVLLAAADKANQKLISQGLPPRIFVGDFFSPFFLLAEAGAGEEIEIAGLRGTVSPGPNGENDLVVIDAEGNEQRLGFDLFEGIISLDGLHLTHTGYALLANSLIEHINRSIGPEADDPRNRLLATPIPLIDITEVLVTDPLSPRNLEAARQAFNAQNPENPLPELSFYVDPEALPLLAPWDRCAVLVGPFQADPEDPCPAQVILSGPKVPVAPGQAVEILARVVDQNGQPMRNLPVSFFIDEESDQTGRVTGEEGVFTNNQGEARATFTGGLGQGVTRIQAQAGGVLSSLDVTLGTP